MSGSRQASLKLVSYLYEPTLAARIFGRSQKVPESAGCQHMFRQSQPVSCPSNWSFGFRLMFGSPIIRTRRVFHEFGG